MSEPERLAVIDGAYARDHRFFGDLGLILATVTGSGQGDRLNLEAAPLERIPGSEPASSSDERFEERSR